MKAKKHCELISKGVSFEARKSGLRLFAIASIGLIATGTGLGVSLGLQGDASATEDTPLTFEEARRINPAYEQYLEDVANGEGDKYNIIPSKYIPVSSKNASRRLRSSIKGAPATSNEDLPTSYNLVEHNLVTDIKNQGNSGTCWAHSVASAAESYLLKNEDKRVNFSTEQMDYLYAGDTPIASFLETNYDFPRELNEGGSFLMASLGFNSGYVPVDEVQFFNVMKTNDPDTFGAYNSWRQYTDIERLNLVAFSAFGEELEEYEGEISYQDITSVKSDYIISEYDNLYKDDDTDINALKRDILENGALYVGTFAPGTKNCYDNDTNTIVDRGIDICGAENGHAMTVVGWDDEYEYTDPATNTKKQGAFILQNSWGKSSLFSDYNVDYDKFVDTFIEDPSQITPTQEAAIRNFLDSYDAVEYTYLAYDGASGSVDYGIIRNIIPNTYKAIYDEINAIGYVKKTLAEDRTSASYTFTTGGGEEKIGMVALSMTEVPYPNPLNAKIYLVTEAGEKELGTVSFPVGQVATQRTITFDSSEAEAVSGEFSIKYEFREEGKENRVLLGDDVYDVIRPAVFILDQAATPTEDGTVTWVEGRTHEAGSENDMTIKINYALSSFESLKIDGIAVAESNYTLAEGSTVITIKHEFLNTLADGTHQILAIFTGHEPVSVTFTTRGAATPTDDQSDDESEEDEEDVPVPNTGLNTKFSDGGAMSEHSTESNVTMMYLALPLVLVIIGSLAYAWRKVK